jgi:hypothetical protein
MPRAKSSKGKGRKKAVLVLGAVGVWSLAASAAANALTPIGDAPSPRPEPDITLNEEEVWDVSLGTFYVFDKEISGWARLGEQIAVRCRPRCTGCGAPPGRCRKACR